MKIAAWLTYNGAPFSGFARQNGQLTVQGNIEEALELLYHHPIETTCAGRTDAGVHALCQVISFDLLSDEWFCRKPEKLLRSLNALTHEAISFRAVRPMPDEFSARFSALFREYHYYICIDEAPPLLMEAFCWHIGKPLDVEAMKDASHYLIGEHDFKSFCMAVSAKGKSTNRFVSEVSFTQEQIWNSNFIRVTVVGNAFLHSMVRTMVGTLALVGSGKRPPEWMREVLEARNRQAAGQNAPAQGLVLWNVIYPDDDFYYDPRPSAHRGELASEGLLSNTIEEISFFNAETEELPRVEKEPAKKSGKRGKKAKNANVRSTEQRNSPWAKWWQEKEKEREMVIPRGPNLEGVTVDPVAAASATPVGQPLPKMPTGVAPSDQDKPREEPVPSKKKACKKKQSPTPLQEQTPQQAQTQQSPHSFAAELEQTLPGIALPADPRSDDAESTEPMPAQSPTVLTAAGARARRRAREADKRYQ